MPSARALGNLRLLLRSARNDFLIFADNAVDVSDEPPGNEKPRWVANPGGPSGLMG
jgi:hypothetical protein